jgi:outer membrane receptor protein involved in Fe transport
MRFRSVTRLGLVWAIATPLSAFAQSAPGAASSAAAQAGGGDTLEEIVVTSERRASDVQKTATSISVRGGADMESQGRFSLAQILEDVPGVVGGAATGTGSSAGSGNDIAGSGVTIRGIQSNTPAGGSVTSVAPATAVYVDGVYEGTGSDYDIDRVEVLRGPQGTLYGRSATAGLVATHTFDPDLGHLGGNAAVEFGNYALRHYTAVANVPLVDDVLGIRVAGNRYERNGYDSAAGGQLATTDGKVKILFKPNDQLSVLLGAALQNNQTHSGGVTITQERELPDGTFVPAPNVYHFTPTPVTPGHNDYRQYWALINWDLGPATLTYQPAYRTWTSQSTQAARSTFLSFNQTINTPKDNFLTHELRLASNPGSKLIWQVGTLFYKNDLSNSDLVAAYPINLVLFNSVTREKETTAFGLFGEATYPLTDAWRVTEGVRYDNTRVGVTQDYTSITGVTQSLSGAAGIRRFNNITYRVRLEHDITAQNMVYGSVSTGVSPGDVTAATGSTGNPIVLELKAETLTAYEIGSKNRFLNDSLQVNGAIYYYDYGSYQTAGVNITPQNPGNPTFATVASPVQVYGTELEMLYKVTTYDRVGVNLAYANAYYTNKNGTVLYTDSSGVPITFSRFYARDKIPGVAPYTSDVTYDHTVPLPGGSTLTLHGDARWHSPYDGVAVTSVQLAIGAYPYMRVKSGWVGDLNATWLSVGGNYSVTGYVRNVADNRYRAGGNIIGEATLQAGALFYDPRTYGAVLSVHF